MAFNANNIVVVNKKTNTELKPKIDESKPHVHNITVDGRQATYDHNVLIIDGKKKAISKSSAYMLDMLTKEIE